MGQRRFGCMVVLFACILSGSPLGFAGQGTDRIQLHHDQSEVIQLAQASGSIDMPSSGMGAGGARPPARINPPPQMQPQWNPGLSGSGQGPSSGQVLYPSGATCRTAIGICPRGEWRPVGEPCYCQRISDGGLDPGQIVR